jgi:hypothetical protein
VYVICNCPYPAWQKVHLVTYGFGLFGVQKKMVLALMVTLVTSLVMIVSLIDESDHNSSAFPIPSALENLELYDVTSRPQEYNF